jgi:hypothetical protein
MNKEERIEFKNHKHTPLEVGPVYEYCACGAVRRRDTARTAYQDPWHVCSLCFIRGFEDK